MTKRTSKKSSVKRASKKNPRVERTSRRVAPNHFFFEPSDQPSDPGARIEQLLHESVAASRSVVDSSSPHMIVADFFLAVARLTEAETLSSVHGIKTDPALFLEASEMGMKAQNRITRLLGER